MIWNCITCGPLKPHQVTLEEKCNVCQEPISFDDEISVPDEVGAAREEREKAERLSNFNKRIAKG